MPLGARELEQVLEVVQAVGQAQTRDEFVSLTLGGVFQLVPCMIAAVNEVDPVASRFVYWYEPSSFPLPKDAARLLDELGGDNPLVRHTLATGDGSAWRISDLCSTEEFHATPLYRELYQPMGMEYQMSVTLPAPTPLLFALVLGNGERDFSDRDRLVMNALRPHLAYAWRNIRDQDRLRALVGTAQELISEQGWGVVVLWAPPEELTPGALVTLYRYFGRPSRTSPFPARVERWLSAQREAFSTGTGSARPLSAQLAGHRAVLRYLPPQRTHPGTLIVTEDTGTGPKDLQALGLSPKEAEVVHLVTRGFSNAVIAERLHVSSGTVRKHLDNVYTKLSVRGRGALTAFVLNLSAR
jgi:DNA-binding CsgD family transcriptional regulator